MVLLDGVSELYAVEFVPFAGCGVLLTNDLDLRVGDFVALEGDDGPFELIEGGSTVTGAEAAGVFPGGEACLLSV